MVIILASEKEKKKVFKRIYQRSALNKHPAEVMFELTYRCNFNCPHCYVQESPKGRKELNTAQVFALLDRLKEINVWKIGFTGGEPLLRKDLFDILEYASKSGFITAILTNGSLIDKNTAKKLGRINAIGVEVTLNALTPSVFDKLSGTRGYLPTVKNAVELLQKEGMEVTIKSTHTDLNRDEIIKINAYCRSRKIIYRLDGELLPFRSRNTRFVEAHSVPEDEHEALRRKVYPEMFSGNRPNNKSLRRRSRMFNCGVGKNSFTVNPFGQMNFCLEIDHPQLDILTLGARTCWEEIKAEVDRSNKIRNFVCRDCVLIHHCGWCPGRSFIESGRFNRCSRYFKERALIRKQLEANQPARTL